MSTQDTNQDVDLENNDNNPFDSLVEETDGNDTSAEADGGESKVKPEFVSKDDFEKFANTMIGKLSILERHSKKTEKTDKPSAPRAKDGEPDIREVVAELRVSELKRQFAYANNLSPEEVDFVFRVDSSLSKNTLDDPFVKGGLEKFRQAKQANANIPTRGAVRVFKSGGKSWKEMDKGERQRLFAERQRQILNRGR